MDRRDITELTMANFANPFKRYLAATRPAFFSASVAATLLGLASALYSGIPFQPIIAILTIVLTCLAILSALPLLFSARAAWFLRQFASQPAQLLPAIQLTLAAMLAHAVVLILVILWKMP